MIHTQQICICWDHLDILQYLINNEDSTPFLKPPLPSPSPSPSSSSLHTQIHHTKLGPTVELLKIMTRRPVKNLKFGVLHVNHLRYH